MKSKLKKLKPVAAGPEPIYKLEYPKPTGRRYKTVIGLVHNTTSKSFQQLFTKIDREQKALIAQYANDPFHKHVREEVGSVNMISTGTRILKKPRRIKTFYWCKICHADMD